MYFYLHEHKTSFINFPTQTLKTCTYNFFTFELKAVKHLVYNHNNSNLILHIVLKKLEWEILLDIVVDVRRLELHHATVVVLRDDHRRFAEVPDSAQILWLKLICFNRILHLDNRLIEHKMVTYKLITVQAFLQCVQVVGFGVLGGWEGETRIFGLLESEKVGFSLRTTEERWARREGKGKLGNFRSLLETGKCVTI